MSAGAGVPEGRVRFNLNDWVFVRLTTYGRAAYRQWREAQHFLPHTRDLDGELRFQGWELMQIFGKYMTMANNPMFVDMVVEIETRSLKAVSP